MILGSTDKTIEDTNPKVVRVIETGEITGGSKDFSSRPEISNQTLDVFELKSGALRKLPYATVDTNGLITSAVSFYYASEYVSNQQDDMVLAIEGYDSSARYFYVLYSLVTSLQLPVSI